MTIDSIYISDPLRASEFERRCQNVCLRMNIFSYSNVLLPYNISNTHWLLLVMDPIKKNIAILDSLNYHHESNALTNFRFAIISFLKRCSEILDYSFIGEEWTWSTINCPKQVNGHDCGVYVITAMLFICDNLALTYDPKMIDDMRYIILESMESNFISVGWTEITCYKLLVIKLTYLVINYLL